MPRLQRHTFVFVSANSSAVARCVNTLSEYVRIESSRVCLFPKDATMIGNQSFSDRVFFVCDGVAFDAVSSVLSAAGVEDAPIVWVKGANLCEPLAANFVLDLATPDGIGERIAALIDALETLPEPSRRQMFPEKHEKVTHIRWTPELKALYQSCIPAAMEAGGLPGDTQISSYDTPYAGFDEAIALKMNERGARPKIDKRKTTYYRRSMQTKMKSDSAMSLFLS